MAVSALSILIERTFARSGITHTTSRGLNRLHGQKNGPAAMSAVWKTMQPFQALQQSANATWVPSAAPCSWYLSFVKRAREGSDRHNAAYLEFPNYRSQRLGSCICRLSVSQCSVDPAICAKAQVRQHSHYGGAMPVAATGGRNSSSVQLVRQCTLGNEAGGQKLPNGQGKGACV